MVTSWNAFLLPLVVLSGADQWTLPLGVTNFTTQYTSDTARILAFTVLAMVPALGVLRDRRATARRRPDQRRGEGLMTATTVPYRDPSLSIDARIADLLGRMTLDEKLAQLGSAWSFQLIDAAVRLDPDQADRLLQHGLGHVTRIAGASNLDAARGGSGRQRDPALPARGDAAGHPGPPPRGDAPWAARPGCAIVPAVDRSGRGLRPGAGPGHGRRRSDGGCWRPAGGSPWRRSSTSRATPAGVGSRRRTARTRTSPWCSAWPTFAASRATTSPTASSPRASTWSVTAWPRAGSTRHRSTSARASCATSSCCPFEAAVRVGGLAAMMPAYCDVDGVPCHASSELLTDDPARRVGLRRPGRLRLHRRSTCCRPSTA